MSKQLGSSAVMGGLFLGAGLFVMSGIAAPPRIPALGWEERSDWINLKTDVTLAAIGDGRADDTIAIQKALSEIRDGSVLYFPPGTYQITAGLVLKNPTGQGGSAG